ncbi:hypothetical protein AB0L25_37955 [Spirillospora sp. NPDC052242]
MRPIRALLAPSVAAVLAAGPLAAPAPAPAAAAGPPPLRASPAPLLWPQSGLEAVSATGPDDVWAAGYQGRQRYWWAWEGVGGRWIDVLPPKAVVTRWDGTSWQTHDLPGTGGDASAEEIDAGSPSNVWVTGTLHPLRDYPERVPFVARWDGTRWHDVPPPDGCAPRNPEADATGAWLTCGTTILRWENGAWTEYDAGAHDNCCIAVHDISAPPGGPAWAATTWGVVRWDGRAWSEAAGLPEDGFWSDVLAVSADEVWATGTARGADGRRAPVLYRWDGETWSEGPAPTYNVELIRTGDGTTWAVQPSGGAMYRLDGGAWTRVDVPTTGGGDVTGATAVPGAASLWAVGRTENVPLVFANG